MHSLRGWNWVALGSLIGSTRAAAVPAPVITPAPEPGVEAWIKRQEPDAVSFAQVLLTAIPLSLRQIAATNAPAVSSILWEEFLDDRKPQWFLELPWEIQSYLVVKFGPETAWPSATLHTTAVSVTPTLQSSRATISASYSTPASATQSTATSPSAPRNPTTIVSSIVTLSTSTRSSVVSSSSAASTFPSTASTTRSLSVSTSATGISSTRRTSSTASSSPSAATDPNAPPASDSGLTKRQKIGLGIGIPLGILGLAALLFACGFLCRRRRNNRHVNDSDEPPSSPGFIPRFAFQDKSTDHSDHRTPLNPSYNQSSQDLGTMNWEDDGYEPYVPTYASTAHKATTSRVPTSPPATSPPMAMQNTQPIVAPVLHHTHSSNRARGRRTSYSSLHSVAELSEPEDDIESPILGRQTTPLHRKRRPSLPMVLEMPSAPRAATIKRKPVPQSPTGDSPAAQAASQFLLRPTMKHGDHSGSSSSGLALSTDSEHSGAYHTGPVSPVSPISQLAPTNPFSNDYSYVEDYGPEYQGGYADQDDTLIGGHRSLDRYPDPSPPRRSSLKTEWPLRNFSMGRRNRSPMWDRVYESP